MATETLRDDTKNQKPAAPGAQREAGREPIPIKSLFFRGIESVQLPDGENLKALHAGKKPQSGKPEYEIELRPWMRQFLVTRLIERPKKNGKGENETDAKGNTVMETVPDPAFDPFLVPESWAISVPLKQ
jgi:hypothetical protein